MKTTINVSICMITYGQEKFIYDAIMGVLEQRCTYDIELIIAEDCSPDNTIVVVNNIIETHPLGHKIKYTRHNSNKGMMSNFIWAIGQCKGNYIAFCEGDDYWIDPQKLQKQIDFLEINPDYSIIHSDYVLLTPSGDIKSNNILPILDYDINYLIQYNCIRTVTCVLRNKQDITYGLSSDLPYGDWPLFLNSMRYGKSKFLTDITAVYRTNVGVTSSHNFRFPIFNRIKILNWFSDMNPKYKMACKYSLALQYRKLVSKKDNKIFKYGIMFLLNYLLSVKYKYKHFLF